MCILVCYSYSTLQDLLSLIQEPVIGTRIVSQTGCLLCLITFFITSVVKFKVIFTHFSNRPRLLSSLVD